MSENWAEEATKRAQAGTATAKIELEKAQTALESLKVGRSAACVIARMIETNPLLLVNSVWAISVVSVVWIIVVKGWGPNSAPL